MTYGLWIDFVHSIEWKFDKSEQLLFAWVYNVPSWADTVIFGTEIWYFASRNKVIQDMPFLTDKPDTVYRLYKALAAKGVIRWQKVGEKDCIQITDKGKKWNTSEINPSVGNKSEEPRKNIRSNSEINPTYYNINNSSINTNTHTPETAFDFKNQLKKLNLFEDTVENRKTLWTEYEKILTADFFLAQWEVVSMGLPSVPDRNAVVQDWVIKGDFYPVNTFQFNKIRGWIETAGKVKPKNFKNGTHSNQKPAEPTIQVGDLKVKLSTAQRYASDDY